jgi:hypothetical protein
VTVYPVIGDPPSLDGAVNETRAVPLPSTAEMLVGDPGTVAGVAVTLTVEESELPTPLVLMTRNVYATPFVRPSTVTGELELEPVNPPGSAITV